MKTKMTFSLHFELYVCSFGNRSSIRLRLLTKTYCSFRNAICTSENVALTSNLKN